MVRACGLLLALVIIAGCHSHSAAPANPNGDATVVRDVDGDTLVVHVGGVDEHVRLIGIDTPETHKPDTPVECFGPEASDHMNSLVPPGTAVRLERDIEARDRYGRLLAYVFRKSDGLFLERAMLDDGYAASLDITPNVAHRAELDAASTSAHQRNVGLWGQCGGPHVAAPAG